MPDALTALDPIQACRKQGVIPIVGDAGNCAGELGAALKAGGLVAAEVTLRSDAALSSIRALVDCDLIVGAGTVLRPAQVDEAVSAGARFIVTPGFSAKVVARCGELGIPIVPGVVTATEIIAALDHGLDLMKFFPAEASGGAEVLRALQGPFPEVQFIPTGGITERNAEDYLALANVAAVGGSWIASPKLISQQDWRGIAARATAASQLAANART